MKLTAQHQPPDFQYQQLANTLREAIQHGEYQTGQKLPGVRQLSQQRGCSIATVIAAYRQLEFEHWIEARPRSGYYVLRQSAVSISAPSHASASSAPLAVSGQQLVLNLIRATQAPGVIQLGAAVPDAEFLPVQNLNRHLSVAARQSGETLHRYEFPPGLAALRHQIARRMKLQGCAISMDEVLITNGCQESLSLALQAVTQAGDLVAIESPCFYGLLQILESLSLKAIEIPTDPRSGLSLEALEQAIEQWPIKACVVVSNFSNPLGCSLSKSRKQHLVELMQAHELPLIEDDIYGELNFASQRRSSCKQFDQSGQVIYCSSFSKSLSPGLRIGWIVAGRWASQVDALKTFSNLASPGLQQQALASFLESGAYDRHLRHCREAYRIAVQRMTEAIQRYFPEGTRISQPQGGFVLWIELPQPSDSLQLAQHLLQQNISIAPGPIFSPSGRYQNCFRLSCACVWNDGLEQALQLIASELT